VEHGCIRRRSGHGTRSKHLLLLLLWGCGYRGCVCRVHPWLEVSRRGVKHVVKKREKKRPGDGNEVHGFAAFVAAGTQNTQLQSHTHTRKIKTTTQKKKELHKERKPAAIHPVGEK
jgi:hypothetical protein